MAPCENCYTYCPIHRYSDGLPHEELIKIMTTDEREQLLATMRTAGARLDYLNSLPEEPATDENGYATIWFRKQFADEFGITYTYCATRIPQLKGLWFVSGPRSASQGLTWDRLISWITSGASYEIWRATEFELVASENA